jgi:hypothetical protein
MKHTRQQAPSKGGQEKPMVQQPESSMPQGYAPPQLQQPLQAPISQRAMCPNPACPAPNDITLVSALTVQGRSYSATNRGMRTAIHESALSRILALPTPWQMLVATALVFIAFIGLIILLTSAQAISYEGASGAGLVVVGLILLGSGGYFAFRFYRQGWAISSRQRARWQGMYYCNRCNSVFVPPDPCYVPAEQMRSLLGG